MYLKAFWCTRFAHDTRGDVLDKSALYSPARIEEGMLAWATSLRVASMPGTTCNKSTLKSPGMLDV